ncbi:MAG: low temperature requirement protein A [Formosimonas sp.]
MSHSHHKKHHGFQPLVRMAGRDPHEEHRVSTTLELLFDLIFVVAIAFAGVQLHHAIIENHIGEGILHYVMVFFAIWWAWMGFSWFASGFDTDDVPYRLAVFVQMGGALVIAAGVSSAFNNDWTVLTVGYTLMRLATVTQWLRLARQSPDHRGMAQRYALGIFVLQVGWVAMLGARTDYGVLLFFTMAALEFLLPVWAHKKGVNNWHVHHISERYGLLTIIVLGESILAVAQAIAKAAELNFFKLGMVAFCFGALLIIFCMWWLYFEDEVAERLNSKKTTFYWGYGHYFIFASAAAVGAGLAAQVDFYTTQTHVSELAVGYAVAVPVALFVWMTWLVHKRVGGTAGRWLLPCASGLILFTPFVAGWTTLLVGLILAATIAVRLRLG